MQNGKRTEDQGSNGRTKGSVKVVSRIMRKIVCRLWQNKISQQ